MPASWEILAGRRGRVLLSVLTVPDGRVSLEWATMLRSLDLTHPASGSLPVKGLPYHAARNSAAEFCLREDYDWLFFLDADTIPPAQAVVILKQTGHDLIGANYRRRSAPYEPVAQCAAKNEQGEIGPAPLPPHQAGAILPVTFLGMGATLISRRCLEAMFQRYSRPFDWGVDVARVPDSEGGELPKFSEDFMFTYRAQALGFQPYLHTGLICDHEFMAKIGGTAAGPIPMV